MLKDNCSLLKINGERHCSELFSYFFFLFEFCDIKLCVSCITLFRSLCFQFLKDETVLKILLLLLEMYNIRKNVILNVLIKNIVLDCTDRMCLIFYKSKPGNGKRTLKCRFSKLYFFLVSIWKVVNIRRHLRVCKF